ncbi:MAG: hypothetical protein K8R52_05660 [Bacteroidales bacterium]|nr:hypothetical protein [Bacteroidales bacterium]
MYDDEVIATIHKVFQQQGYLATVEALIKVDEVIAKEKQSIMPGLLWRYLATNKCDKAMDLLEKRYEIHHPSMPYISTRWDQLKENPRYIALLKKMNLPLPED